MKYLAGALALGGSIGIAHADSLSVFVGQDFSEGDYGAESESTIGVTSFGARVRLGDWSLRASSGYIDLGENPDTILTGLRGREIVVEEGDDARGFTDLSLGVTGPLLEETDKRPAVTLMGSIKLPTADEEAGLGTGATDFGASVEFSKTFGDVIGYSYVGGRLRGESDVIDVSNSFNAGVGVQRLLGEKWVGSLSYDFRGASFEGGDDAHEVTALVSYRVTKATNVAGYLYTGFTDVSPDLGFGVFVSHRLAEW